MSLNPDTIEYITHLARLELENTRDGGSIQDDLNKIVAMVGEISAANTDGIEAMAHPFEDIVQALRPDVVTEPDQRDTLLALAPLTEAGLFLVPTVLD
jgi:aspartyl-tRNA(Asn)/glutamyl-tRNA(Gln) amidotransferase subunit C